MRSALSILILAALAPAARAQTPTTGAIVGKVTDAVKGGGLGGVTVIARSLEREDPHTAITEDDGTYKIDGLLPGEYAIDFFAEATQATRDHVRVGANDSVPIYLAMAAAPIKTIIEIHDRPPLIKVDRTDRGFKRSNEDLTKLPQPGATIDAAAGAAPGATGDGLGVAFSGSTSLENRYLVDGIDITGLTYGTVGTPVLNEFVEDLEVLTGGYNAEWGRATGGIVNAVTKSGTNTFRGMIFGRVAPGVLARRAQLAPVNASSIDIAGDRAYQADLGAELGGPIVKDHAWFFVGVAPSFGRTDYTRAIAREVDCHAVTPTGGLSSCDARLAATGGHADSQPDLDPKTGFYLTDLVDREVRAATTRQYSLLGKVDVAATPRNQGQVTVIAVPSASRTPGLVGLPGTGTRASGLTTDVAARWTSKLDRGRTELSATVAWHRSTLTSGAIDPTLDAMPREVLQDGTLGIWSALGGESPTTSAACHDGGADDPYPYITNCPMRAQAYATGGPGTVQHDREERRTVQLSAIERARLVGTHELKAGLDVEDDRKQAARLYSGGAFIQNDVVGGLVRVTRYVQLAPTGSTDPRYDRTCSTTGDAGTPTPFACAYTAGEVGAPGTLVDGQTGSWAAYLRDSWQPIPSLTLNLGARYEQQKLYYARAQRGTVDPLTQERVGDVAMNLTGNVAPRVGVMWDPTEQGRAKLFAAFGRFYEAIPMDINDRSFGGEVTDTQTFSTKNGACGAVDPRIGAASGMGCLNARPTGETLLGSSGVLVAPGIKAEYLDEGLIGAEWMVGDATRLGVAYQQRSLGRVIEDVSTDGAKTYVIANPGEWSHADEAALAARAAAASDAATKARLEHELALYKGIRTFDHPTRDYRALELTLAHRVNRGLFVDASYTYSRTHGNYPGSASYDNGQVDPNISSQYDLVELLANRAGALPQDRPHSLKLDAYYTWRRGRQELTLGGRARVVSGTPIGALGSHYAYGPDESFLLPRGALGRTPTEHGIDLHLAYQRALAKTTALEIYADVLNVYDDQRAFAVDQTYAPAVQLGTGNVNNANPISGGTYRDLVWAKALDANGTETASPIGRNPNFKNPTQRYAPMSAQLGFRLRF